MRQPLYFEGFTMEAAVPVDVVGARCLLMLGDSISTDHTSPVACSNRLKLLRGISHYPTESTGVVLIWCHGNQGAAGRDGTLANTATDDQRGACRNQGGGMMPQVAIPAVYMRGGTSRAIIFHAEDLPSDPAARDAILLSAIGSPDPNKRQLDGLGGAISSLSKIAIVGPSSRPDADVDYTFGQVAIDAPVIGWRGNCGNISSAIGPFAIDEGLVAAEGSIGRVRIHNTNTGKVIVAEFPLEGGKAAVDGEFALPGVAGTGAPVRLAFLEPGGAVTGSLLPTGAARDILEVPGFGATEVSLVDAANPVAFTAAASLGLSGTEAPGALEADPRLMAAFEDLRVAAALRMGIVDTEAAARTTVRNLPQVGLLSAPVDTTLANGTMLPATAVNITVRMISAGQPHRATPLTGAMCLAVAIRLPGTLAHALARPAGPGEDMIIGHPSGTLPVAAQVTLDPAPHAAEAVVYRTARRLMEGRVLIPRSRMAA